MAETKKRSAPKTEVELTALHRHEGEDRKAGEKIKVTAADREFLLKHKKIK